MVKLYTDYPFRELGDEPFKKAPIREVVPLNYDGNKYCDVLVEGIRSNIKSGYIYLSHGRCGEVESINPADFFKEPNNG